MKKCLWVISALVILSISCMMYVPADEGRYSGPQGRDYYGPPGQGYGDMSVSYFYNYLAPYGSWVYMRPHGYVWVPRYMGYRWRPYTHGHWVWTDYGWTWISEYDWGWIPFHYGRWGWDDAFGWFWVPGTMWGPAWVIWRASDLYMGWAPLPPDAEFAMGMGLSAYFDVPDYYWIFIEGRYFFEPRLYNYALPYERNLTIVRNTTINRNIFVRNNRVINEGIDAKIIRNVTRKDFARYNLRDEARPGMTKVGAGEVQIYRPAIKPDEKAIPKEYMQMEEARTKLSSAKIYESSRRSTAAEEEGALKKRHFEEERLLEKSQSEELRQMKLKLETQQRRVTQPAEKEKIRKEMEGTISDLRKKHDDEKKQLSERHKKDSEQVVKGKTKKDKDSGRK